MHTDADGYPTSITIPLSSGRYANLEAVPYTELEHDLSQLARIEAEVRALGLGDDLGPPGLDEDMYLQPNTAPTGHDYIQPIP